MKRSWHVGAMLLPSPTHFLPFINPPAIGDVVDSCSLLRITRQIPETMPIAHLFEKSLSLCLKGPEGSGLFAKFPDLSPLKKCFGRIHLPVITSAPAKVEQAYISGDRLHAPFYGLRAIQGFDSLFVWPDRPHLLLVDKKGKLLSMIEGYYLTPSNIRQIALHSLATNTPDDPPYYL